MKRKIFTTLLVLSLTMHSFADDPSTINKEANVSSTVQSKFAQGFAGAQNVTWEVNDKFQKAYFTLNGQKFTAFYNLEDEFVATTHIVNWNMLPASALHQIGKSYRGYMIRSVIQYTNQEKAYFVCLIKDNKELLVSVLPDNTVNLFKRIN